MVKSQIRRLSRAFFFLEYRTWFVALFEVTLVFFSLIACWLLLFGARRPEWRVLC